MPKFTVTLTETLTHRLTVEAATDAQAMEFAASFLSGTDHNDCYLFSASGFEAACADPAPPEAEPDLIAEEGA